MKRTIYKNGNSKSANAEYAEDNGRYPLTTAAKKLGITPALFKKAIEFCNYRTNEWHHVSKYANKVDYYDTVELLCNYKFIVFLKNRAKDNRLFVYALKELAKERLTERLTPKQTDNRFNKTFEQALKKRCADFKIPFDALFDALPADQTIEAKGNYRVIQNGTYEQNEVRVGYRGVYETGYTHTIARVKYIIPFDLTLTNIRTVFKANKNWCKKRLIKGKKVFINRNGIDQYNWILNRPWLLTGIENLKKGTHFTDHNSGTHCNPQSHKCKRKIEAMYNNRIAC